MFLPSDDTRPARTLKPESHRSFPPQLSATHLRSLVICRSRYSSNYPSFFATSARYTIHTYDTKWMEILPSWFLLFSLQTTEGARFCYIVTLNATTDFHNPPQKKTRCLACYVSKISTKLYFIHRGGALNCSTETRSKKNMTALRKRAYVPLISWITKSFAPYHFPIHHGTTVP